jgi:hypothetical protein
MMLLFRYLARLETNEAIVALHPVVHDIADSSDEIYYRNSRPTISSTIEHS